MTVWLLPGQGAQKPGMGAGLAADERAARVLSVGSEVLDIDLEHLVSTAEKEEVDDAFNAQAATMAVSIACGSVLLDRGIRPDALIGFSLGQISALALSGMLSLEDTFALLKVRASAMAEACRSTEGAMLAVLRMGLEDVESIAEEASGGETVAVANHNGPGQYVVSGTTSAIGRCKEIVKSRGGKCVVLNTAGAFHTPLMHDAAKAVQKACSSLTFHAPKYPIICNTDGRLLVPEEAAERLSRQVESPVLFEESVRSAVNEYGRGFLEVGYGKVLTGLVGRIDPDASCCRAGSLDEIETYVSNGGEVVAHG